MSEVYCLEPPCRGRVIINTSHGELDIRLWSTQCPKAARNFVQLCIEGFYNNCIFHRIIPQFLIQTGDPTGTGNGGESIYGEPFENETHSRLKFRYRGMVGMANTGGKCSNNSQFFITLERADCLNGKYTLFGKVEGHTVYNLMKLSECEIDKSNDRPINPPKIISVEVLNNPFPDIIPRLIDNTTYSDDEVEEVEVNVALSTKKKCLLSFGDDCDDETDEKTKIKNAHDLIHDPHFSKNTITLNNGDANNSTSEVGLADSSSNSLPVNGKSTPGDRGGREGNEDVTSSGGVPESDLRELKGEVNKGSLHGEWKERTSGGTPSRKTSSGKEEDTDDLPSDEDRRNEIEMLEKRLRESSDTVDNQSDKGYSHTFDDYKMKDYKTRKQMKKLPKKNIMDRLADFTKRLSSISRDEKLINKVPDDTDEDLADGSWFAGKKLRFAVDSNRAYEVDAAKDALEVFDPIKGKDNRIEFVANLKKNRNKLHGNNKTNLESQRW